MVSGDEEVKLLLEAFQMSVSACLSQPSTPVLRAQMLGRLMSVPQSSLLKVPFSHFGISGKSCHTLFPDQPHVITLLEVSMAWSL